MYSVGSRAKGRKAASPVVLGLRQKESHGTDPTIIFCRLGYCVSASRINEPLLNSMNQANSHKKLIQKKMNKQILTLSNESCGPMTVT